MLHSGAPLGVVQLTLPFYMLAFNIAFRTNNNRILAFHTQNFQLAFACRFHSLAHVRFVNITRLTVRKAGQIRPHCYGNRIKNSGFALSVFGYNNRKLFVKINFKFIVTAEIFKIKFGNIHYFHPAAFYYLLLLYHIRVKNSFWQNK